MSQSLIASLERAVAAAPDDHELRLHLARLLIDDGRGGEAVAHCAAVLATDAGNEPARALMARALAPSTPVQDAGPTGFDWHAAEHELDGTVPPMFAHSTGAASEVAAFDVEGSRLTLADVGGMHEVKRRLDAAFLAPMRNEELRRMYRKSLRGGLLLYGPPGTGKTHIARALAGELGAAFLTLKLSDILDQFIGQPQRNVAELFETARANRPCVLFLDELDAIGGKRSRMVSEGHRTIVNTLLEELDGIADDNDGLFLLAATNHPWDVDSALRRPGRLDRTLLVLPPDHDARVAIWQTHLRERPVAGADVQRLAALTDGYTGADIAHACESAAERALLSAVDTGVARMIEQRDLEGALREVRPSVGAWFETARNVATFANEGGEYDELLAYFRKHRRR